MVRQIRKSKITKSKISLGFFWQLIIAFALVTILVGGGMFLAGRAALNKLDPFARDTTPATARLWADRLAAYYGQQSSWEGVDTLIAGYPCGPGWSPWDGSGRWITSWLRLTVR